MAKDTKLFNFQNKMIWSIGAILVALLALTIVVSGCGGNESEKVSKKEAEKAKTEGLKYYQQGKLDKAIGELKKASEGNPKDLHVQFSLAQAYVQKKKLDDAYSQYKEILKTDNKSADAHFGLGLILSEKNKLDEAIKEFETAAKLNSFFTSVRWSLAEAYVQKGDYKKALTTYGELAKILKSDTFSLSKIHFMQGEIFEKTGKQKEAENEFKEAVKLNKNNKEAAAKLK